VVGVVYSMLGVGSPVSVVALIGLLGILQQVSISSRWDASDSGNPSALCGGRRGAGKQVFGAMPGSPAQPVDTASNARIGRACSHKPPSRPPISSIKSRFINWRLQRSRLEIACAALEAETSSWHFRCRESGLGDHDHV